MMCFSGILLTSCATTGTDREPVSDLDPNGSDCISIRTIRDYTPLDRSSLIMEASGKRFYYVTLVGSAFELRSAFQIGVESRDDWLCPYGGDRLLIDGPGLAANFGSNIRGIDRITEEQAEELLFRHGRKERQASEEGEEQAPPQIEGAEVEEIGEAPNEHDDDVPQH